MEIHYQDIIVLFHRLENDGRRLLKVISILNFSFDSVLCYVNSVSLRIGLKQWDGDWCIFVKNNSRLEEKCSISAKQGLNCQ